jgi:hypothetical protein
VRLSWRAADQLQLRGLDAVGRVFLVRAAAVAVGVFCDRLCMFPAWRG